MERSNEAEPLPTQGVIFYSFDIKVQFIFKFLLFLFHPQTLVPMELRESADNIGAMLILMLSLIWLRIGLRYAVVTGIPLGQSIIQIMQFRVAEL